jgi:hypothetical protein
VAADSDDLDHPPWPQPPDDYEGIPNAWGQYGVSDIGADVTEDGAPCVYVDTSMCETTLSIEGAEEMIRRLQAAVTEAKEKRVPPRT